MSEAPTVPKGLMDILYKAGFAPDQRLFDFQVEDVLFMYGIKSVLIGNEMGLGKTPTAIARDLLLRADSDDPAPRTLVVAPLTVLPSWKQHFEQFAPGLTVRLVDRKNRHSLLDKPADVYLVHWEVLAKMPELRKVIWHHVIADECHKGKNRKAGRTIALKELRAKNKTAMSGTPMVNRPDELWSILDWLYRYQFGGYWQFYKRYVDFEIVYPQGFHKIKGCRAPERLREQMKPFYVRRLKKNVLKDLPDKYYTTHWVDLGPKQRKAYNEMRRDMITWLETEKGRGAPLLAPVVIAKLVRLQQLALAYGNVEIGLDGTNYTPTLPSAKIDALLEVLDDLGEGQQVVIFSQFSKMIDLTERVLRDPKNKIRRAFRTVKITGAVKTGDRETAIQDFQAGRADIFLGTVGAGGVGITLTAASTVIFLDRDWSPANNLQAEDRLHRIGQKNAVQVIDLVARDTVDLGRMAKLEQKWEWIRAVLDGEVQDEVVQATQHVS